MSPESILTHLKREAIHACVSGIENCPIPVIVEFANGDEAKIQKVYHVGGRASCVKILVDELPENEGDLIELSDLKSKVEQLKEENEEYEGEIEDLKGELENWTNAFGDDSESTKKLWEEIEESIGEFAKIAEINLVANDATNIRKLQSEFEDKAQLLSEADEIIAELKDELSALKVENRGLACNIKELMAENEKLKFQLEA